MESYISSPSEPGYSQKSLELISVFQQLIAANGIKLEINPSHWYCNEEIAVDIEHDEQGNLVGIGTCNRDLCIYWTEITEDLKQGLESSRIIAHNGISDFECLRQWGINVKDEQLVHDTMLFGHILDSSLKSYGLKDMASRELSIRYPSYDDIVGKRTKITSARVEKLKKLWLETGNNDYYPGDPRFGDNRVTLDKQPLELVAMYNALDCFVTYQLYEKQNKSLSGVSKFPLDYTPEYNYFNQVEKPASLVFAQMSDRGIRVDLDYLKGLKSTLEAQQRPLKEAIINELGPINLNSPKQLLEALNAKEIYPQLKGKGSTDKRALEYIKDMGCVRYLLRFSELETLLSSFVYPYLQRNQEYVHPFFNQVGTRTGRVSCSNPNLLQIPRRTENGKLVRRMFIPRDGMVMGDCDFGQIEPRVLAHLSKDPALCQLFIEGTDFHAYTASRLGIDRERAKILNLSVGYRATFKSVSAQLRCSNEEAQAQINQWWSLFPVLRRWQDKLIYESKASGFCTTLMGRRIRVDDLAHGNSWRREGAERQLINNITQGSAAEIMKMAMIRIHNHPGFTPEFGLLVQIYDELLIESKEIGPDINLVKECMEMAVPLEVPLTVDCKTGANWAECH